MSKALTTSRLWKIQQVLQSGSPAIEYKEQQWQQGVEEKIVDYEQFKRHQILKVDKNCHG